MDDKAPAGRGLRKTLGPLTLWGLGVGYVISGMYCGWNLGLPEGGPGGMLAATLLATVFYAAFVPSYASLARAMPGADGAFLYARRAFGDTTGLVAGFAQLVEFALAPPAIAKAIGDYAHALSPSLPATLVAVVVYVACTALNVAGLALSAVFELTVTVASVVGLVVFGAATVPHLSASRFWSDAPPFGPHALAVAVPYALWFYLGIEGLANVAEETADPARDLRRGFVRAMATLVVLTLIALVGAVGVGGWRAAVFVRDSNVPSDSPLPLALGNVFGRAHPLVAFVTAVGLCGLRASFHGLLLVAGRALFALGRAGAAPRVFGRTSQRRGTPVAALGAVFAIGLVAIVSGETAELIVLSVLGALTLYVLSLASLLRLRTTDAAFAREAGHPVLALVALALALPATVAVAAQNVRASAIFAIGLAAATFVARRLSPPTRAG